LRQRIAIVIGLLVSVVFVFLAFRGLHPEAFLDSLASVNVPIVVFAMALYFVAVALISWRWQFLLKPVRMISIPQLMQLVSVCYMGNNVYPLRAGEVLRVFLLRQDYQVPIVRSSTVTVVERVFDGIVMLTFILVGIISNQVQNEQILRIAQLASPFFVLGLVVFFGFALFPEPAETLIQRVARILPERLQKIVLHLSHEVLSGLASLKSPVQLFGAVFASYASWMVEALVYWVVMSAFGFDLPYTVALLVVGTVNLAGLIPASPGQIGVYEFFVGLVLSLFAIEESQALAYAIVVHITIWLPVTVVGFVVLARRGLSVNQIRSDAKIVEPTA
jgi:glycosyltransferase 2 family protein